MEFALATLKIALNGWNPTFLLPLIGGHFGAVNLWTRPLQLAFGHLIRRLRAQKWPLEAVKRRENRASLGTEASQTA